MIVRIDKVYEKYSMIHLNYNLTFITLNYLRNILKNSSTFRKKKSVIFNKTVTVGYIFDLVELRKQFKL